MIENLDAYDLVERYISLSPSESEQEFAGNHPQQESTATVSTSDAHGTVEDLAPESTVSAIFSESAIESSERKEGSLSESGSDPAIDNQTETREQSMQKPQGSVSTSNSPQIKSSSSESLSDGKWKTAVKVCTAGWVALFVFISVLPDSLGGLGLLILWFGLPIAIYKDSQELKEYTNWPNHRWIYIGASLVWFLNIIVGAVYLWRRSKAQQKDSARFARTTSSDTLSEAEQQSDSTSTESKQNHQASTDREGNRPSINISMSMKGKCRGCGGRMDLTTDEDDTLYGHCEECGHQFKQPLCQYQGEDDSCQKRAVPGTSYCYEHRKLKDE